jgi:acetolactate synthase-1/2/3 large subunit
LKTKDPTVAELLAKALARHGVEIMFSQSLPSALLLAAEDLGIRQYSYRTENAGTAMADGYARVSRKIGVVTAQNGPAATLLVPGLAEALKASIPVVALVQDVNRNQADRNAFQELDHLALFGSCTKWTRRVTEASRVIDYLDMAVTAATSGRPGPTALILPADLLIETVTQVPCRYSSLGHFPLDRQQADPDRIAEAADLLANAKRPLVVAGGGVHISGAYEELRALQDQVGLPVTTTVMGKGSVDESHPLSLGVGGYALGKLAPMRHMRAQFDDADVVLLIGTRTNQNGTDSWTLYPHTARYIHIDVDGGEVGRNYEAVRLIGDAKLTLAALISALGSRRRADASLPEAITAARIQHGQDLAAITNSSHGPIRPERLMQELKQVMTSDTIVATDASYSTLWAACYLPSLSAGSRFITPRGLAGLGWGFPLAIGAKIANPESPVICVVGDGGFGHCWQELETVHRTKTPVVLIVLNNGVLGYQKDAEDVKFGRYTTACHFDPVDHTLIAKACGCEGVRVERIEDFLPAVKRALTSSKTMLIDVMTDPAAYPPVTFFDPLDDIRAAKASHQL